MTWVVAGTSLSDNRTLFQGLAQVAFPKPAEDSSCSLWGESGGRGLRHYEMSHRYYLRLVCGC